MTPRMMKRQMAKSLVLAKKMMSRKITWLSSKNKKKRKSSSASKSKKSAKNKKRHKLIVVLNSLRLSAFALKLRLLKRRPVAKQLMKNNACFRCKNRKS